LKWIDEQMQLSWVIGVAAAMEGHVKLKLLMTPAEHSSSWYEGWLESPLQVEQIQ